uniref:Uncharacterized protein n=1 Tax=Peronospora matthiolae TaxID=2874970 RepID=A0AAV1V5Y1_9STRA
MINQELHESTVAAELRSTELMQSNDERSTHHERPKRRNKSQRGCTNDILETNPFKQVQVLCLQEGTFPSQGMKSPRVFPNSTIRAGKRAVQIIAYVGIEITKTTPFSRLFCARAPIPHTQNRNWTSWAVPVLLRSSILLGDDVRCDIALLAGIQPVSTCDEFSYRRLCPRYRVFCPIQSSSLFARRDVNNNSS